VLHGCAAASGMTDDDRILALQSAEDDHAGEVGGQEKAHVDRDFVPSNHPIGPWQHPCCSCNIHPTDSK
jgi:hypothetical protein